MSGEDHTEGILGAITFAAGRFAEEPIWRDAVPDVLQRLGETVRADRAYVYRNYTQDDGSLHQEYLFEWAAEGVTVSIAQPGHETWPYAGGLERWVEILGAGGALQGPVDQLPIDEQKQIDLDIVSMCIVPVFVEDTWWGYLGFDDCHDKREWTPADVQTLKAAAAIIGGAVRRSRLELKVEETEERFRTLVENIPAVLYIDEPGLEMYTSYVGPQLEPMLGITAEQWMTVDEVWQDNMHPDDRARVEQEYLEAMDSDTVKIVQEYRIIRPDDGRVVWIRDDTTLLRDDTGELRTIMGVMFDVTPQKEAEEALKAAQTQYQNLVENIPAVVYLDPVSSDQKTHYISPRIEDLFGVTAEQYIEEVDTWASLIHPDDREASEDAYERFLAGEGFETFTYRMVRPDGRVVWVQDTSAAIVDDSGKPVMVQGFFLDVTAQKEAEAALAEAQAQYKDLVENVPAVIYMEPVVDPTLPSYISPRVEEILGVTQEAYLADRDLWTKMLHPDDRDRQLDIYTRFLAGEAGLDTETYRMVRPDGTVVWIRDSARLLHDPDGNVTFVQGFIQDVTAQMETEERLSEAQARFRTVVERIPVAVYTEALDSNPEYFYMSPQIKTITGWDASEFLDPHFWESHLHSDDASRVEEEDRRVSGTREPFSVDYRFLTPDEGIVWLHEEAREVEGPGGQRLVFGVISDITEQREAAHQLALAQEQYKSLVEGIPAMVYLDPPAESDGSLYVSPRCEEILGITAETYMADVEAWFDIIHVDDRDRVREVNDAHLANGVPLDVEYRIVRPNGTISWVNEQAEVLLDEEGKPFLIQGVIFDITERKEAEAQIAFLAYHDALTGLANRALFEEMLEPALARARRADLAVAVMFMDLDKFKLVNDTHGHAAGDELLKQVSHRLLECVRDTDVVARQGGDEFLVLLSDLEPGEEGDIASGRSRAIEVAEALAERIRNAMRVPFQLADVEINTSASIGVSVFPFDAADARTLLKHADSAMYESKQSRPGSFSIHARSESDPLVSEALSWRLRRAVKEQAWDLHYQPVVELDSGTIVGAEALLRWHRPEGGFVPPSDFIPLAEEMGLLEIIGEWVFEEICRQRAIWLGKGIDLTVSFNLSPRQLWQRDLVERLAVGLRGAGMAPSDLLIEVAESTAMADPPRAQRVLWALHEEGFRVAIDDFGTGYSPVARIWHLPIDVLKIDQPLVRDLPEDMQVDSFVGAVIEFARERGTVTHAEGIETPQQRKFLVEAGCELGQGYLFSKPLPPSELTSLWQSGSGRIDI